jgi:hypothetical protein
MDKVRPDRRKVRSYTVAALLGLFVVAAVLALATRLLPGGLSRLAQRTLRGDRAGDEHGDGSGDGSGGSNRS